MSPRYEHPKTKHAVETSNATEGVQLKAAGYREAKARTTAVREADAKKADAPKS